MKVSIKKTPVSNKEFSRQEIDQNLNISCSIDLPNFLISEGLAQHRDEARILLVETFKDVNVRSAIVQCIEKLYEDSVISFQYDEDSRYKSK